MKKTLSPLIAIILITSITLSGCNEQNKPTTQIDTDGDGYNDTIDAFPTNPSEWNDTDNDGVGDNTDTFPHNASEWIDSDGDGIGDNTDYYPNDNNRWEVPQTITITTNNTTQTIYINDQEIKLIISSSNCNITIPQDTLLVELIIQGNNNTISLSINHTFILDDIGTNNEITYYDEIDPIIEIALPYLQKINTNNNDLRDYAETIISGCSSHNQECQITTLYRYIIANYNINTTNPDGTPQTPQETIQKQSGTHNDLTILLISLIENININTFLTIVDNLIYTFIPNIDTEKIWTYSEASLITQVENDWGESIIQTYQDSFSINSLNVWYYGGDQDSSFGDYIDQLTIDYTFNSDQPLHIFVVHRYSDFYNLTIGQPFNHYTEYEKPAQSGIIETIQIPTYGGFVFLNEGANTANVTVDFTFTFNPSFYSLYSENNITEYSFDSTNGILLDISLGDYGFPGNNENIGGELIIISIDTKDYQTIS